MEKTKIDTILGLILCKYDENTDDFLKWRIVREVDKNTKSYELWAMHLPNCKRTSTIEEIKDMIENQDFVVLESSGILAVSIVNMGKANGKDVNDVRLMWFKRENDSNNIYMSDLAAVASQALNDIYAESMGETGKVGLSVTKDTLPAGFELEDFLGCVSTISCSMYHIYKTDKLFDITNMTRTKQIKEIFKSLYENHINYLEKTKPFFDKKFLKDEKQVDGYCKTYTAFIKHTGFYYDIDQTIGIGHLPFRIEENQTALTDEQVVEFMLIYGGIRVHNTFILKFDYTIDLSTIKMKHCLCKDDTGTLYIIGYTESQEDIAVGVMEHTLKKYEEIAKRDDNAIKARLKKLIEAYDSYEGSKN